MPATQYEALTITADGTYYVALDGKQSKYQIATSVTGAGGAGTAVVTYQPPGSAVDTHVPAAGAVSLNVGVALAVAQREMVAEKLKIVVASFNGTSIELTVNGYR